MKEAFIIDFARSPIGKIGGSLSSIRPDNLAAHILQTIVKRNPNIDLQAYEDVILGCANQSGEDNRNIARMSLLLAGLPIHIGGETVNRLCASGMASVINAYRAIACGEGDIFLAGGIESMTRAPYVISKPSSAFGRDAKMEDSSFGWRFVNPKMKKMYGVDAMGETAENLAKDRTISREEQDAFALHSQQKATHAQARGRFKKEIIPIPISLKKEETFFNQDEFIKSDTTLEGLAKLKPAFRENGTVTAGNSSGLNDGSAIVLMASSDAVKKFNLNPLARIVSSAIIGVEPRIMGIGPVEASNKALRRANLKMNDIDIIELNEAFAAQSLACIKAWGLESTDKRINPNGGAIALGHPLGMSGTRIIGTASLELALQKKKYALCTMCIGVGQGYATIIENVSN